MSRKRRTRFRYTGWLARQLRSDESIESKIPILLADLGVTNRHEGFVQLALRHVPGFQRGKRGAGKRTIDHATEAQFFELVDELLREAVRMKRNISPRQAVMDAFEGLAINNPIRELTYETMYTYYKERAVKEQEYETAHNENMRSLRGKFISFPKVDPIEQQKRISAAMELDRILGPGDDSPLKRKKRRSPRG